jgi:hypothetical protein
LNFDGPTLGFALKNTIHRLSQQFMEKPDDVALLLKFEAAAGIAKSLPFEVSVWRAQNNYYSMMQDLLPGMNEKAQAGDSNAQSWVDHFMTLGRNLSVRVEVPDRVLLAA